MRLSRRRPLLLVAAFVVGAAAGLLLLGRDRAQELTAEGLAAARRLWRSQAPDSYTLELEMRGALNETRIVVVDGGRVVGMTAGGVEAPRASWEYWSVEGLFDVLATELANAADPGRTRGAGRVALLVRFDPSWGYPSYFYRHIMGSLNDIEWEVVRFTTDGAAATRDTNRPSL